MEDKNPELEEQETVEIKAADRQQIEIEEDEKETTSVGYSGRLRRKVYSGMWGPLELGVVGLGVFLLVMSLLFYLLLVVPASSELASDRKKRDELDTKLREVQKKYGDIDGDTQTEVQKLIASAEDFEFRFLREQSVGASAIYQRLNALIAAYGLRNTAGPDYEPLLLGEKKGSNDGEKSGRDKFRSLFPGIYITSTVEGPYPNLRRFLKEIETSSEFIAVTAVELEPSDEEQTEERTTTREVLDENKQKVQKQFRLGKTRGNRVNLRIEMAAYFRRPGVTREPTEIVSPEAD